MAAQSAFTAISILTPPGGSEEQLKALDPPPFTYEGRQYTAYEAQQQMRKMERKMRKQKDRCVVAEAVGDKDAFNTASIRLRQQKDCYENFCKAAGTYTEYERTFVTGYNRQLAAKTGAVTRKQNAQITLTNSGNGGIINQRVPINSVNKTIRAGKQQQHILGSADWLRESKKAITNGKSPKSALYKDVDPQEIIDNFSGKGEVRYTKKSVYPEEFVDVGKTIGITYDKKFKKYIPTSRVQIVHSQNGAHVFPVIERGDEKK